MSGTGDVVMPEKKSNSTKFIIAAVIILFVIILIVVIVIIIHNRRKKDTPSGPPTPPTPLTPPTPPTPPPTAFLGNMNNNPIEVTILKSGESLFKDNFRMMLRNDGNLVIEDTRSIPTTLWQTRTINEGTGPYTLDVRQNGSLCIHDSNNKIIWCFNP